jgi:hypothetical protein
MDLFKGVVSIIIGDLQSTIAYELEKYEVILITNPMNKEDDIIA